MCVIYIYIHVSAQRRMGSWTTRMSVFHMNHLTYHEAFKTPKTNCPLFKLWMLQRQTETTRGCQLCICCIYIYISYLYYIYNDFTWFKSEWNPSFISIISEFCWLNIHQKVQVITSSNKTTTFFPANVQRQPLLVKHRKAHPFPKIFITNHINYILCTVYYIIL